MGPLSTKWVVCPPNGYFVHEMGTLSTEWMKSNLSEIASLNPVIASFSCDLSNKGENIVIERKREVLNADSTRDNKDETVLEACNVHKERVMGEMLLLLLYDFGTNEAFGTYKAEPKSLLRTVQMRTIIEFENGGTNLGHLFHSAADQFSVAEALPPAQHI
ncbi:hypothetical protein LXL04_018559 [Taraxacum kok-saghyz]